MQSFRRAPSQTMLAGPEQTRVSCEFARFLVGATTGDAIFSFPPSHENILLEECPEFRVVSEEVS